MLEVYPELRKSEVDLGLLCQEPITHKTSVEFFYY